MGEGGGYFWGNVKSGVGRWQTEKMDGKWGESRELGKKPVVSPEVMMWDDVG